MLDAYTGRERRALDRRKTLEGRSSTTSSPGGPVPDREGAGHRDLGAGPPLPRGAFDGEVLGSRARRPGDAGPHLPGAGFLVAGGTDSPVIPCRPVLGDVSLHQPRHHLGRRLRRDQHIAREDALKLFTINNARLTLEDNVKGSIESGKLADLVVLSADYLSVRKADRVHQAGRDHDRRALRLHGSGRSSAITSPLRPPSQSGDDNRELGHVEGFGSPGAPGSRRGWRASRGSSAPREGGKRARPGAAVLGSAALMRRMNW